MNPIPRLSCFVQPPMSPSFPQTHKGKKSFFRCRPCTYWTWYLSPCRSHHRPPSLNKSWHFQEKRVSCCCCQNKVSGMTQPHFYSNHQPTYTWNEEKKVVPTRKSRRGNGRRKVGLTNVAGSCCELEMRERYFTLKIQKHERIATFSYYITQEKNE